MDSGILMIQDSILVCSPDPRIPQAADVVCIALMVMFDVLVEDMPVSLEYLVFLGIEYC
jgi:hypothetical protein